MVCALQELGCIGNEVGAAGERRVIKVFDVLGMPEWMSKPIRRATQEEDARGVDAFLITDVEEIPIQIKTSLSKEGKELPKRNDRDIAIIYMNLNESDSELRRKIIRIVSQERRCIIEDRKASR
ncbi:hypothetical protein CL630_03480 [bacterium]|nr:hypothetical protein [bacterium]|tara:strand:- start:16085 stop:16456 length:372 start_codon:yes stop_codon:yes gene_type:complete